MLGSLVHREAYLMMNDVGNKTKNSCIVVHSIGSFLMDRRDVDIPQKSFEKERLI